MKDPVAYLIKTLLRNNRIRVNEDEFEFQFLSHPTYPSLHAITGVLDHFAIKNYALDVPKNVETLNLLPSSFLALIKNDEYNGFVLICKHNHGIQLSFDGNNKKILATDSFLEVWTGVIVIIENDNQKVVAEVNKPKFIKNVLYLITIALLAISFLYKANLFQSIHFLLTLVGVAICCLILQHELGLHSKILDKFCSEENEKTSCDAVLKSKGATLFGAFKFSDVGIIYFVSLILSWSILKISNTSYFSIILITVLAIPFTFYSLYYQYKVVKKWCLLCLSVVLVLWLHAASLYFTDLKFNDLSVSLKGELSTALCFLATFALWQFVSPKLIKEQELNKLKIEHYKFKRSYNIFKSLILKSEIINTLINDSNEIVFVTQSGSPLLRIVIITNPLCGFCKEAHELVENLLKIKNKNIQVNIRFNVRTDYNSIETRIALKLIEIFNTEGEQLCLKAMHDIYNILSPNDWLNRWGEPRKQKYRESIIAEKNWCKQNNINFTPEILVNGRSFPNEYYRADLLYFVDDIFEEEIEKINLQTPELEIKI